MMRPLDAGGRVLVRLPSRVGDFVTAEPFADALYETFADAGARDRLSFTAPAPLLELYEERFEGARRIPLDKGSGDRARAWRGHATAVLLTGSFRSALAAFLARIPRRVGWSRDLRGALLTDAVRPPLERGAVPHGLGRVGFFPRILPRPVAAACHDLALGLGFPLERVEPFLAPTERGEDAAALRLRRLGLDPDEPFLVANAGSPPGSAKRWPAAHWVRALDSLALHFEGVPTLLVCGPGEEDALEPIVEGARSRSLYPLIEPPVALAELAALAARARVFLTTDTGPRHVAAAVGAPVVCLFGPTDPRHTGQDLRRTEALRVELPCGPCHRERCPLRGHQHHSCMQLVDPEKVLAATRRLFEERADPIPETASATPPHEP